MKKKTWHSIIIHSMLPMGLTVILFFITNFFLFIPKYKRDIMEAKRKNVRELVQTAWNILELNQKRFESGELTYEQAQRQAVDQIRELRYGKNNKNYFWINDYNCHMVMHPYRPDLDGTDLSDFSDSEGVYLFKDFVDIVKKSNQGYVVYKWQWLDKTSTVATKISFVKGFKPWKWIVGTGIYLEDVKLEIAKLTRMLWITFIAGMVILVLIGCYIVWHSKKTEEKLSESEILFQAIFNSAFQFIGLLNPDGILLEINKSSLDFVGKKADDVVGKPFWETPWWNYSPLLVKKLKKAILKARKGEFVRFETEHVSHDSRIIFVDFSLKPIKDPEGNVVQLVAEGRDIVERKRIEGALKRQEENISVTLDSIGESVIATDSEGVVTRMNPTAEWLTGYRKEEGVGKRINEIINVKDPLNQRIDININTILMNKVTSFTNEKCTLIAADGRTHKVTDTCCPIMDKGGFVIGTVLVFRDLTEEVELKKEIAQRKKTERELIDSQGEIKEASRMAGMAEIATGVLHNVGNVLNSINVSVNVIEAHMNQFRLEGLLKSVRLLVDHKDALPEFLLNSPRGKNLLTYLDKLAVQLGQKKSILTNEISVLKDSMQNVKDVIKTQHKYAGVNIVKEVINPLSIILDALRLSKASLLKGEVTVVEEYAVEVPDIVTDKHKVLQILINLLQNAQEAAVRQRGISADNSITLSLKVKDETWIEIVVRDNGIGIEEENIVKIFSYGYTQREGGHGFGLHISAIYAKELGGNLQVVSDGVGKGAEFVLTLPIKHKR